jgi:hypothetical protein
VNCRDGHDGIPHAAPAELQLTALTYPAARCPDASPSNAATGKGVASLGDRTRSRPACYGTPLLCSLTYFPTIYKTRERWYRFTAIPPISPKVPVWAVQATSTGFAPDCIGPRTIWAADRGPV